MEWRLLLLILLSYCVVASRGLHDGHSVMRCTVKQRKGDATGETLFNELKSSVHDVWGEKKGTGKTGRVVDVQTTPQQTEALTNTPGLHPRPAD